MSFSCFPIGGQALRKTPTLTQGELSAYSRLTQHPQNRSMAVTSNVQESDRIHKGMLLRAVIASTVGTSIEWYDFFLYSTVTGLVFAKAFFPNSDPLVGTLQAFLIYAVGFIARPVGAAIFGHYGDRMGRKAALVATLMLMGIATFLVGLVPTYSSIG